MVGTRYTGIPPRQFNGVWYHYRITYKKRKQAQTQAKYLRWGGRLVRVIKVPYGYNLFVAHEKRSRRA